METWREELYAELYHHGIEGQKWGIRRFQNEDGTLTEEGRLRYLHANMTARERRRFDKGKLSRKDAVKIAERQNRRLKKEGVEDPGKTEEAKVLREAIFGAINKKRTERIDSELAKRAMNNGRKTLSALGTIGAGTASGAVGGAIGAGILASVMALPLGAIVVPVAGMGAMNGSLIGIRTAAQQDFYYNKQKEYKNRVEELKKEIE